MMTMVSSGNTARIEVYAQRLRRDSNAKRTMVVTMSLPNSDAGAWEPTQVTPADGKSFHGSRTARYLSIHVNKRMSGSQSMPVSKWNRLHAR